MKTAEKNDASTRDRIIASAIEIIRDKGIRFLTVRGVCREAGCTAGAFYHYFPGKDELMATIIADARERISEEEKEKWLREQPVEFLVSCMVNVGVTLSSFGVPFIREFLSPGNQSLDITYLLQTKSGKPVVNDLIVALTNASMKGMFREETALDFSFIDRLYRELNSVFYGCVFDWALGNGSYDLKTHLERMLRLHLQAYMKPEHQVRRIRRYESMMREAEALLEKGDLSPGEVAALEEDILRLEAYYGSSEWKQDFTDDEAGLLPENLERGVLSEDGIYDLLEKYRERNQKI